MWLLLLALTAAEAEPLAALRFDGPEARLTLRSLGEGRAVVEGGTLLLDLTAPRRGKAAGASLDLDLPLPCRLTWEQCLEADSPHAYLAGAALSGQRGAPLLLTLGGAGSGHRVQLPGRPPVMVPPGTWVRWRVELQRGRVAIWLTRRDDGVELSAGSAVLNLPPPLRLRFFANSLPEQAPEGDGYDQNRGSHRFDNLVVERPLPRPGEAYDPRQPVVFNRAMRWADSPAGPLAWSASDLALTGQEAVSTWVAGGAVTQQVAGPITLFRRPHADALGPERIVLRGLQFHLGQHPRLRYRLEPRNAVARLWVAFTEPYLPQAVVIAEVPATSAPQQGEIDLVAALARWGEERVYAELDLVLELGAPAGAGGAGELEAVLSLPRQAAVIAPPYLARPASGTLPIAARVETDLAVDSVVATHTAPPTPLRRDGELWRAELALPPGRHRGEVVARLRDGRELRQRVVSRSSATPFVTAEAGEATYGLSDGRRLPPLLGDLFAWVPWNNPTQPTRTMVRQLDDPNAGRPPLTKWRAMTGPELAARLDYLHGMGLRVVRLTPNTTPFESYLDAGGHVAPHGLEQLQRLLDALDARGLRALINLFHYAYGSPATGSFPPVAAYGQAGYLGPDDWGQPAAVALQRGYLAELLTAIGSDPAVLGYTLFGENDDLAGEAWLNSTAEFVRLRAPRQRLVFEQGGGPQSHRDNRPDRWDVFTPARDGGVGYRTYYSEGTPVDAYANLAARWYALTQPAFLAETCSDGPGWHGRLTWLHPDFITQLRDSLWASLLAPQAMALTWSVCLIEPERIVPTAVAERLDWQRLRRAQGLVAMRVAHPNRELLPVMAAFDQACCRAGVTYDFLPLEADPAGYGLVFDAARDRPPFDLEAVLPRAPIKVSAGNAATVLLDAESRQMAAYVRNVVEHRAGPGYGAGTQELHRQRSAPREVLVELRALPDQARLTVWDLDTREVVCEGPLGDHRRLALGRSAHDFALVASTH